MKVRRVKDPAGNGRVCYQWGYSGRVYCGKDARKNAIEYGKRTVSATIHTTTTYARVTVKKNGD